MKPSDLSEFFSLLGKAKKEKEEEFDNLLKEADINLDDLTSSLVSGIKEAKDDQKQQKKNEEKLIEQLDSIIDVIENPKEVKDITEPVVTVGVPEDFDVSKLEEDDPLDVQDWNNGKDIKFTEVDAVDIIKPEPIKTPEISDTVAQAIKFIEETNIKEEIENSDETNLDRLKTEIKQVRDILYKVLAHGPGSGEVRVLRMDDVDITDLGDEKVLSYDASSEKLKFVEQSGGSGVSTENVRTGILDVAGIATFRNDTLVGSGITLSPDGDIFVTGVTTATKFVGDGSGLTGITASGSGVVVQDEGSNIGTAATINFIGSNVTAALSGGIANVTVTPGITTANVRTGILDVAGISTFRNDTLIGSGVTLSPDGDVFTTGVTTSSSFVGDLTGDVTGTASNATQLNSQAASYYLNYNNFSNTPTIPSNNNQLTNGASFITASDDITGNAATSTKLATARTIAGVSFDGSANISLNNNAITNGAGYITTSFTNTNQLTNGASFITASDDITGNAATATALANARTIAGVSFDGSANISLNNNAITNGAGYITGSALNASNLSSGTIPDARFPSTLPAIDGSALTGIAVTDNIRTNTNATFLQNVNVSGTTTATTFIGNLTGNVTGNVSGSSGSSTGNAATATALANARTIGGVSFDGSANIDLPGVNSSGNQDTSGNAATATKLAATKTIAGVAFDGSANISLNNNAITNGAGYITATLTDEEVQDKVGAMFSSNTETGITATYQDADGTIDLVVGTLNQDTTGNAATATTLETARNIGGVSFDGSANIDLPGVNSAGNQNTTGTSTGLTGTPSITVNAVNGATGTFSGNVTIGGVLTYEDVTNVDSIGVITARSGVRVGSGITLSPDGDVFATGVTTSTTFVGALTGNVTGNASGSSGSCTGNAATATKLAATKTIAGVAFDGSANISLNNNAITNGAGYITATLTDEEVQDKVGAMFTGNTETGITATYQDADGTIDLVVGTLNQDTTGNAATATALETARNIGGVSFDGSANIDLPGVNSAGNQDTTGNAATATKLAATKTIAGVAFDGSANISLNNNAITNGAGYITATLTNEQVQDIVGGMVSSNTESGITVTYQDDDGTLDFSVGTLNQDTTGNAATATTLATARNIGGVSFDGSANISLPGVNSAGNQNTSGTAAGLSGTPNITVGNVTGSSATFGGETLKVHNATNSDSDNYIQLRAWTDASDNDRNIFKHVTGGVIKSQITKLGGIFGHSSVYAGRTRTDQNSPSNVYANGSQAFIAYSGATNDTSTYRTSLIMRAWDGGDTGDRNALYFVDSGSDTTAVDYDQHQKFGVKANGMAQFLSNIFAGRVESDEGSPNNVMGPTTGSIVAAYPSSTSQFTRIRAKESDNTDEVFKVDTGGGVVIKFESQGNGRFDGGADVGNASDYAEYFEWLDGNTSNADRRGITVVLDGEKIRPATDSDDTSKIIGVVSANPAVVGDSAWSEWQLAHQKDAYGSWVTEDKEYLIWNKKGYVTDSHTGVKTEIPQPDITDPNMDADNQILVSDIEKERARNEEFCPQWAIDQNIRITKPSRTYNPDYDPTRTYEPRSARKEWSAIGLVGKLVVRRGQPIGANWILMKSNVGTDPNDNSIILDKYLVR